MMKEEWRSEEAIYVREGMLHLPPTQPFLRKTQFFEDEYVSRHQVLYHNWQRNTMRQPRIFFKTVSLCSSANSDIAPGVRSHTRLQKTGSFLKMAVPSFEIRESLKYYRNSGNIPRRKYEIQWNMKNIYTMRIYDIIWLKYIYEYDILVFWLWLVEHFCSF